MVNSVEQHLNICKEANELYRKKNLDYGDSFHETFLEEGWAMVRIRLSDKLNRFKRLTINGKQEVKNESIRDILIDILNYSAMAIMELDNE